LWQDLATLTPAALGHTLESALRAELAAMLQRAGVREVAALLPSLNKNVGGERQRTARVNTLKTTVKEVPAWLRAPPAEHAEKWGAVVRSFVVRLAA